MRYSSWVLSNARAKLRRIHIRVRAERAQSIAILCQLQRSLECTELRRTDVDLCAIPSRTALSFGGHCFWTSVVAAAPLFAIRATYPANIHVVTRRVAGIPSWLYEHLHCLSQFVGGVAVGIELQCLSFDNA